MRLAEPSSRVVALLSTGRGGRLQEPCCTHIYIYIYIHICTCIHICTYVYIYIYVYFPAHDERTPYPRNFDRCKPPSDFRACWQHPCVDKHCARRQLSHICQKDGLNQSLWEFPKIRGSNNSGSHQRHPQKGPPDLWKRPCKSASLRHAVRAQSR